MTAPTPREPDMRLTKTEALARVARYVQMRDEKPISQTDDMIHDHP